MHSKMMELMRAGDALKEEYNRPKSQVPPMTEAAKQQIIKEYEESPELTEKIIMQFSEGYQSHKERIKAKMLAAGIDTKILDFSDEEDETEDLPPHA